MADNALFTQQTAPAELPTNLQPVTPVLMQRGKFAPKEGGFVVVDLGGETLRCEIQEVLSHDVLVVLVGTRDPMTGKVVGVIMDKTNHGHRSGSTIAVQRVDNELAGDTWKPVSDREVREQETIARVREQVASVASEQAAKVTMPEPAIAPPPGTAHAVPPSAVPVETVSRETPVQQEEPRKVLGPRRTKVRHVEQEPVQRRVLGPRHTKLVRKSA